MNSEQCRMARAGLGLGAKELADLAEVSYPTLNRFEKGERVSDDTARSIQAALEAAGAQFSRKSGRVGASVPERD